MQRQKRLLLIAAVCLVAGAWLRWRAVCTDFWLDEIWSLRLAETAGSVADVFRIRSDNNHFLNTLFLFALRGARDWRLFRLLSLCAGCGMVIVAFARALRSRSTAPGLLGPLFAFSYPMILLSSEARGYAPAALFCLIAFGAAETWMSQRGLRSWLVFSSAVVLALLSHLTSIFVYLSLLGWSAYRLVRVSPSARTAASALSELHAIPVAVLLAMVLLDMARLAIGGGPPFTIFSVIERATRLSMGLPDWTAMAPIGLAAAAACVLFACYRCWRHGSDRWLFYAAVLFVVPAGSLVVVPPVYLAERYFFVCLPFFLMAYAECLEAAWRGGRAGRIVCAAILLAFFTGNLVRTSRLLAEGRGHYLQAVRDIEARTDASVIVVGSDHDFRNGMVLDFYSRYLGGKTVRYVARNEWSDDPPEWFVTHSFSHERPARTILESGGWRFALFNSYPYADSGWQWDVWRLAKR